jgi:hypothetical protein
MAPLRHAVSLIDGEDGEICALQQGECALLYQPLRRNIEDIKLAVRQRSLDLLHFAPGQRGIEECGADADFLQRIHLILHERNQRRDDDTCAVTDERGDLIAERLAAARWHQREHVAPLQQGADDGFLMQTERLVAERFFQDRLRILHGWHCPRFQTHSLPLWHLGQSLRCR